MGIEIRELESNKFDLNSEAVFVLPINYLAEDKYEYSSTALSFYKYAKTKLKICFFNEPELLVEQRSGEWFAPVLLFTSTAISNNPEIVSITCGVISNYITDFFKGQRTPNIRLKILHKETKTTKLTEISYEGNSDFIDSIKETISKLLVKDGK